MPKPEWIDDVILRTLIREFGALSYEFSLESTTGEKVFRAHSYFGSKVDSPTPDSFPHLQATISWGSDLDQIKFLLKHVRPDEHTSRNQQSSLFQ